MESTRENLWRKYSTLEACVLHCGDGLLLMVDASLSVVRGIVTLCF